jgi:hypothetical protein
MADHLAFSYRGARSSAITTAFCAVVAIESVAVHFAVAVRHPLVAWTLSLTSVAAFVWLVRDYRSLGSGAVLGTDHLVRLRIGRRFDITIPLARITRVLQPTFRDLPAPGTNQGRDYLNLTKPAAPNVLIVFDETQRVRLTLGIHREVRGIALRLDDADGFVRAVSERLTVSARSA